MSWLDQFFVGYVTVAAGGVALAQEPILNFVNATAQDNPLLTRTDVTLASGGAVGGGATGTAQTGAVVLPGTTGCIAVDLTSGNATCNLAQISSPVDGYAVQLDLVGSSTGNTITFSGATIMSKSSSPASTPVTTLAFTGTGQSIFIKYNAANTYWTVTTLA